MTFDPTRLDPVSRAAYDKGISLADYDLASEVAETDTGVREVVANYVEMGWTRSAIRDQMLGLAHDRVAEGRFSGITANEFKALARGILDQALDDSGL